MAHIKCRYVQTDFDDDESGSCPYPSVKCFEKDYKRFEYDGKLLKVGYKQIWANPPANDPLCMYTYDCIMYLEVDGEVIIDAVKEATEIAHRWISVNNLLPEANCDVLLYANGEMEVGWLGKDGQLGSPYIAGKVTHWMLLPEPPEVSE